eukprot:651582-Pelagomonas_calceolata.AAC.1
MPPAWKKCIFAQAIESFLLLSNAVISTGYGMSIHTLRAGKLDWQCTDSVGARGSSCVEQTRKHSVNPLNRQWSGSTCMPPLILSSTNTLDNTCFA